MLRVTILLSTFNGSLFINDQIVSILDQNNIEFKIVIRDDGSNDETVSILKTLSEQNSNLIILSDFVNKNIGIKESFDLLLNNTESDIYLYADQDDIWLPNKLYRLMETITKMNNENSCLVFSDMDFIDTNGYLILKSFIRKKLRLREGYLRNEFLLGHISGCLMVFNTKAKEYYLKYNSKSVLHDYHMLMTCFLFGEVYFLKDSLVLHRIHNSNFVGTGNKTPIITEFKDLLKYFFKNEQYRNIIFKQYFNYIENARIHKEIDYQCRIRKIYNRNEIKQLKYFERKIWYYKHFFSLEKGILRELNHLLLF